MFRLVPMLIMVPVFFLWVIAFIVVLLFISIVAFLIVLAWWCKETMSIETQNKEKTNSSHDRQSSYISEGSGTKSVVIGRISVNLLQICLGPNV